MKKAKSPNTSRNRYVRANDDQQWVIQNLEKKRLRLFYYRNCLLPCLDLQLSMKERSRDELGDADLVLLNLIAEGVTSEKSLSLLTGLAPRHINTLLLDMSGRGLVDCEGQKVELGLLGKETVETGVPLRLVKRALRYCAVSSRLLPREAYGVEMEEVDELDMRNANWSDIIPEQQTVPLRGLDLAAYENKHAFNLTDETIAIEALNGYQPCYIRARLCLVGRNRIESAYVQFGRSLTPYSIETVKPLTERFDLNRTYRKVPVKELIETELAEAGVELDGGLELDELGLPRVTITSAPDEWLAKNIDAGTPAVLLCGTRAIYARPISAFANKPGLFNGYTLSLHVKNEKLESAINTLRDLMVMADDFFAMPPRERPTRYMADYLRDNCSEEFISVCEKLIVRFDIRRARKWFSPTKDAVENESETLG